MPTTDALEKYINGGVIELKAESDKSDRMLFSGYASTNTSDLVDDIVEPNAFTKHLYRYKANPVICYNHDRNYPIGKSLNVEVTDRGLYMDMELFDFPAMPIVKGYIWPCIKEGVLSQMSIGFLSLDGKWEGKNYHHKEVYLLENSVVTVACNPDAMIGVGKSLAQGLQGINSMADMIEAYNKGALKLPEELSRNFYMGNGIPIDTEKVKKHQEKVDELLAGIKRNTMSTTNEKSHPLTPDFTDIKATPVVGADDARYDSEGEATRKPYPSQKNYHEVHELICAAKREANGKITYLFEIGYPTAKGFAYDWSKTALTMCRIFGAKGTANFNDGEKVKMVNRLCTAYAALDKVLPSVTVDSDQEVSIDLLTDEVVAELNYKDINFSNGEPEMLTVSILETDMKNIQDVAKAYKDKGDIPTNILESVSKGIYAMLDIWGFIEDEEDATLAAALLALVAKPKEEDEHPSAYDEASAPTGDIKLYPEKLKMLEELKLLNDLLG